MTQYNLNRNYALISLTTSGTGNKSLTWAERDLLVDGDTTTSGVALTASDILYLETDLTDRLKVDGVRLYMSSPSASGTVLNHINFYYKNTDAESFSLASKAMDVGGYYYATIPTPSAPRYLRATISGLVSTLHEYVIFNDDYLVGFGEDGSLYRKYLDRATIGTQGTPTSLPIFNNNTDLDDPSVDAYICVDYSGEAGDYYLKLASSENSSYYGLDDGGIVEDDDITSYMRWSHGSFDNTEIVGDSVVLSSTSIDYDLGNLPLADTSFTGWQCMQNCWEWNALENRIFCMGSDDGPQLKLWEYFPVNNTFDFLSLINPSGPTDHAYTSSMAYIDGKVYACMNSDGKFGYYDTNGVVNNWTALADIPETLVNAQDRIAIVGDQERYIYAVCADSTSAAIPAPNTSFHRYDTISGTTWETLDNTIRTVYSATDWGVNCCLTYDKDRNCIYFVSMDAAQEASTASDFLQRYDIDTDTWNNTFFRLADYFTPQQRHRMAICYHRDYVYLFMENTSNVCYRIVLNSFTMDSYNFVSAQANQISYIVVTDPPAGTENIFGATVFVTGCSLNSRRLYGYGIYNNDGTYTTPVFTLPNSYMSSYFVVENTTDAYNNISWDNSVRNGTVMHRSSDTEPIPVIEYYWPYRYTDYCRISKVVLYNEDTNDTFININGNNRWSWSSITLDPLTGTLAVSMEYTYSSTLQSQVRFYDRTGVQTHTDLDNSDWTRSFEKMEFESGGGIWAYCLTEKILHHFNSSLLEVDSVNVGSNFLDFTVETDSDGAWSLSTSTIVLYDYNGTPKFSAIALSAPSALCGTSAGGVWVVSQSNVVYRYDNSGNQLNGISLPRDAVLITKDYEDGFWYSDNYFVAHVDANGEQTFSLTMSDQIDHIVGGLNCCIAFSATAEKIFFIDKLTQIVTKEFLSGASWKDFSAFPDLFSYNLDTFYSNGLIEIPLSYDPVWEDGGGTLEWNEIQLNGGFLPKHKFHQLDIKLQTAEVAHIPTVDKIIMAPAVKLSGIASQKSRDLYIKTDVPIGAEVENYETKLRTWWSVIDA